MDLESHQIKALEILALVLVSLGLASPSSAQTSGDVAQGLSPYATYLAGDIDNVNPGSGNVFVKIPLLSYPQRGSDLKLDFYIFANNKGWYINPDASCQPGQLCGVWTGPQVGQYYLDATVTGAYIARAQHVTFGSDDIHSSTSLTQAPTGNCGAENYDPCTVTTDAYGYFAMGSDGAKHYVGDSVNQTCSSQGGNAQCPTIYCCYGNTYAAVDGSNYVPIGGLGAAGISEVVDASGVHYTTTATTDRNGNQITVSTAGWQDTLNRQIPGSYSGPGFSPGAIPGPQYSGADPLPGVSSSLGSCPTGTTEAREWIVPASQDLPTGQATYYLCYTSYAYHTQFDLTALLGSYYSGVFERNSTDPNNLPAVLLTAVVLPNNQSYTFTYDEYLFLTEITLPTGGSISYTWQTVPFGNPSAYVPVSRALQTRKVHPGHGQPDQSWTYYFPPYYAQGSQYPGSPQWSVVTDPEGNDQEYQLTGGASSTDISATYYYSGCGPHDNNPNGKSCTPSGGSLVKSESYILTPAGSGGADDNTPPALSIPPTQRTSTTTTFYTNGATSSTNKMTTTLAAGVGTCTKYTNLTEIGYPTQTFQESPCRFTNQTVETDYYDFGTSTPGNLLRTDKTTFKWQQSDGAAYFNANLLALPGVSTQVGGGISAETDYLYDGTGVAGSGAVQHVAAPGSVRGNLTTQTRLTGNGPNEATAMTWYDTGVVNTTQDGNQIANPALGKTTYSYSANYANAYVTGVLNALGQPTSSTYDFNTGKIKTSTDANGQPTSYTYMDSMSRLTDVKRPNVYPGSTIHGETSYSYTDSYTTPSVTISSTISPSATASTTVAVDGLGRQITKTVSDAPSNDVTDTNYDALGRVLSVSNPHRTSPSSSDGTTSFVYDAIGRKTTENESDGVSQQKWMYTGNVTDYYDQTNRHWTKTTDGLGRLTKVLEPDPSGTPSIETDYQYDGIGNLLRVDQYGGSASSGTDRVRTFQYDSASRLEMASNPETGNTCYGNAGANGCSGGYDANGNLILKMDARGISTNYSYDALNRLQGKTYTNDPANTPPVGMVYDSIPNGVLTVGRLVQEYTGSASAPLTQRTITQYDPVGEVLQETQCVAAACPSGGYTLQSTYDVAGNLLTETNGASSPAITLMFNQDSVNRLESVSSNYDTDAQHPATLFSARNTTAQNPSYGPIGLLNATMGIPSFSETPAITRTLQYDNRERIVSETDQGIAVVPATQATGSITITGSEQSAQVPGTPTAGSGTATIAGSVGTYLVCASGGTSCRSHTDGGTVTITVNGFAVTVPYAGGSTAQTVAQQLAVGLNASGSPVAVTLSGSTLTITSTTSGPSTNYSLQASATLSEGGCNKACRTAPDFSASLSGSSLTGGTNGTHTIYDAGSITASVDGINASAPYNQSSSSSTVATALASALMTAGSGLVSVGAPQCMNGTCTIGVSTLASGASADTPLSASVSYDSVDFSASSFQAATTGLSGATDSTTGPGTVYSYSMSTSIPTQQSGYDADGNVVGFTDQIQGQWSFGYDNLKRLTMGTALAGVYQGLGFNWAYDPFGNRESQTVSGSSQQTVQSTPTFTFANSNSNRIDGANYDSSGNLQNDGQNQYAYDAEGRLCAVAPAAGGMGSATAYLYDAEGRRMAKGNATSCYPSPFTPTTTYLLGAGGEQLTEFDGSGNWRHTNAFANGALLATYDANGTHFALNDWIGTKRVQTSAAGETELNCMSLPFGDTQSCYAPNGAIDATEHHFTGKERDPESGDDYFFARYFASLTGRFMSPDYGGPMATPDAVPWADFENPQSMNLYSYGGNNPLSNTDDDGHDVQVCTPYGAGGQDCKTISNDQYAAAQKAGNGGLNVPTLEQVGMNGNGSGQFNATNITDANGATVGTATYVPENAATDYYANRSGLDYVGGVGAVMNRPSTYAAFYGASALGGAGLVAGGATAGGLTLLGDISLTPTAGEAAYAERLLAQGGRKAVEKAIRTLGKRLAEHQGKLGELQGNPGSVQREIAGFTRTIEALKQVLR